MAEPWDEPLPLWCSAPHCLEAAIGELDGVLYCANHAELVIERQLAVELAPQLRETLPGLWDE